MDANTGTQLPVASCSTAAAGPPNIEPIPCAIYRKPKLVVACFAPNVSVKVDGNSEKISPQPKNTTPESSTKASGSLIVSSQTVIATASSAKAQNIVFSRPMRSETQPKNGRVKPL